MNASSPSSLVRVRQILLLTTVLPGAQASGGEIATLRFVEALRALGSEVTVLGYARPGYVPIKGEIPVATRVIEVGAAFPRAIVWAICAFLVGRPFSVQKFVSTAYRKLVTDELSATRWDAVLIDHAQMGWLLPVLVNQNFIHVSHNNETALYERRAKVSSRFKRWIFRREARLIHRQEIALARASLNVWTLTPDDADYFSDLGAEAASFPIPSFNFDPAVRSLPATVDVVLLGSWSWGPNRAGLIWFCENVLPQLSPDIEVVVGGQGVDDLRNRFKTVRFVGRVPDAASFLASARCIAIPAIEGAGIQIKTLDAIAIGRPVVATPLALRAIDAPLGRVKIADDPYRFAASITEVLSVAQEQLPDDRWSRARTNEFMHAIEQALDKMDDVYSGKS